MPNNVVEISSQATGDDKDHSADRNQTLSNNEVIEVISDDEVEVVTDNNRNFNNSNRNRQINVSEHELSDDEIQITHVNTLSESPSNEFGQIRRVRGGRHVRNTRRRFEVSDDDVQLINERPILRPLSANAVYDTRDSDYSEGLVIHTPRGDFQSNEFTRAFNNNNIRRDVVRPRPRTRRDILLNNRNLNRRRQISSRFYSELEQFEIPFDLFRASVYFPSGEPVNIENSIMERIERDNDNAVDSRLATEKIYNRKFLNEKKELTKKESNGYTNDISPKMGVCCELCAIPLGEGMPDDFEVDHRYDTNIEEYSKQYHANAPWFCIRMCSEADIALSKRVFIAKCGHVYCGRCVKNIGNRPPRAKTKSMDLTILNPQVYSPRKCPAPECNRQFSLKGFTELYF